MASAHLEGGLLAVWHDQMDHPLGVFLESQGLQQQVSTQIQPAEQNGVGRSSLDIAYPIIPETGLPL